MPIKSELLEYLEPYKPSKIMILQVILNIDIKSVNTHLLTMVSTELVEQLRRLNRVDKLQVIQLLAAELANEENNLIKSDASYPVWSPYDAVEAANIMLEALNAETSINHE